MYKLNSHACKRAIHSIFIDASAVLAILSAHQIYFLKVRGCVECCQHAHLIRHLRFGVTVFELQLQEVRTVQQSSCNVSSAQDVKKAFLIRSTVIAYVWEEREVLRTWQIR